jgi:paired amphipathic helix protein Sin3a
MFTLDRVVAAIVKQTQTVLGDMKSQELFALLQRDRQHERTTTRQQIAYRYQAEGVLGAEENLYKVQYVSVTDLLGAKVAIDDGIARRARIDHRPAHG